MSITGADRSSPEAYYCFFCQEGLRQRPLHAERNEGSLAPVLEGKTGT